MANIKPTISIDVGKGDGSAMLVTWAHLVAASLVGDAIELPEWADNCVQVIAGTTGSATCVIEGSNGGTTYGTLNNAQGTALSFSATGAPKQIVERPRYIRPSVSGGGGTEDWTVTLMIRRPTPMRT